MQNAEKAYKLAQEAYAEIGVDTDSAMNKLSQTAVSLHCWQGDDVSGFENPDAALDGGIMATGNYPGKARTAEQLRMDLDKALSLIPGTHRLNLHAIYGEFKGKKVDRDQIQPEHFSNWIDWAKSKNMGLDFNGTFFSHPKASSGFTLSSKNEDIRKFWVRHAAVCRKIGEVMGKQTGKTTVTNIWIPDGSKDIPFDRKTPREILKKSLDEIFAEKIDSKFNVDAVECKLFGIGSESYVVGSHEFYMGYAVANKKLLCLDTGHFHPTEVVSDKISSVLQFVDEVLLHVSRPVRWDSDHVVILNDELFAIAQEIVRGNFLSRVRIGLDFFDASINRIAAWVVGTRCMLKALLAALLEPAGKIRTLENNGDYTSRLAIFEELKTMPFGAVWDYYCQKSNVPVGMEWLSEVKKYEAEILSRR